MYPQVKKVTVISDYIVECVFNEGTVKYYDFEERIKKGKGLVTALKDPEFFKKVEIGDHGCLQWPNGVDIAGCTVYDEGFTTLPRTIAARLQRIVTDVPVDEIKGELQSILDDLKP